MRRYSAAAIALVGASLAGCETTPDDEKGADHTVGYYMRVEASEPGVSIETNGVFAGKTPLQLHVFGDKNGFFHNLGSPEYSVRALPIHTNQFPQAQVFSTGNKSLPGARIPGLIFFDMNQKSGSFSLDLMPEK
jgi:hypothetical protein